MQFAQLVEKINEETARDPKDCNVSSAPPESSLRRFQFTTAMDKKYGYETYVGREPRNAWLINIHPTEVLDESDRFVSAVDYYFIEDDGSRFKVSYPFKPYFYIAVKPKTEQEVMAFLSKRYAGVVFNVETVLKEDLEVPNHLIGIKKLYVKLTFLNVSDLIKVRKELMPKIRRNKAQQASQSNYSMLLTSHFAGNDEQPVVADQTDNMIDIREYDVPYHIRASIDMEIYAGCWYTVAALGGNEVEIHMNTSIIDRPEPTILAFDIETTKAPLKFPDAQVDQIMMISYMIDTQGFLIINREIISADVEDFEYTPKPEYEGQFIVFNEKNEYDLLVRFFEHITSVKPNIIVTYNGDAFDWPFIEARATRHELNMRNEIGFEKDSMEEYKCRQCIHMDAFRLIKEDIWVLANYSVSDAVATYYLYTQYVHPFVFALCTIIPMEPDEVLRKGSGTLCEALLMVKAFHNNIVFPNKKENMPLAMTKDGHMIDSETYVGGHVEALESGVFRTDIPCRFRLDVDALRRLSGDLERTLQTAITAERIPMTSVKNFLEKCEEVRGKLRELIENPMRLDTPLIYHLDVGAMYPNIILTNRLQPTAIVNDRICAVCDFNKPKARCQKSMEWMWRAETSPANRSEYQRIVQQLENEKFPFPLLGAGLHTFHSLPKEERQKIENKRLQDYCRKAYKRIHETRMELRKTVVCQRENSFYVDTVRAFRDRRYEYKAMLKGAKAALERSLQSGDASEIRSCRSKVVLYDSLQLAHKCILNSFYGYVMRRGRRNSHTSVFCRSRWHSMEMAGIVCYTGGNIIKDARILVDQIGYDEIFQTLVSLLPKYSTESRRPLELDTDGIWCMFPSSFPGNITFEVENLPKSKIVVSYPAAVLNLMVIDKYTNDQYHTLIDPATLEYQVRSENSIAFEVDGPYRAMILPASKEEGKKLKKRYIVFNFDGSIAELKGFEIKRRGELQLLKIFQSSVFDAFLQGKSLNEVYGAVAKLANYWLDILYSRAVDLPDSELFELIAESRNLSKRLDEYGKQKSTSITTARRLAEFLGDQMVKDSGLNCRIIIVKYPPGAPVSERAIPLDIFFVEKGVCRHFLKKWMNFPELSERCDIRDILDWDYYIERLGSAIQKIITIPAALQGVPNPVPRVGHPDWLHKRLLQKNDSQKQKKISDMFKRLPEDVVTFFLREAEPSAAQDAGTNIQKAFVATGTNKNRDICDLDFPKRSKHKQSAVEDPLMPWRQFIGPVPKRGPTKVRYEAKFDVRSNVLPMCFQASQLRWLSFMKGRWKYYRLKRRQLAFRSINDSNGQPPSSDVDRIAGDSMRDFFHKGKRALLNESWQIVQIISTAEPGVFNMWVLISQELRCLKLTVPRIFYINQKIPKDPENTEVYRRVNRILPRANPTLYLYEYQVPEEKFIDHLSDLDIELSSPHIEGIYETHVPLLFRALVTLGCLCRVNEESRYDLIRTGSVKHECECFSLKHLEYVSLVSGSYLEHNELKSMFIYNYNRYKSGRSVWSLFIPVSCSAKIWLVDRGISLNVPNLKSLYIAERNSKKNKLGELLPEVDYEFEAFAETNVKATYLELCRYLHVPIGNIPNDATLFGADLFFARHLIHHGHVLWCSSSERPDLGGKEMDDSRLVSHIGEPQDINISHPSLYSTISVEMSIASLPVCSLLQSHRISEQEGVNAATSFGSFNTLSVADMVANEFPTSACDYDEVYRCASSFRILKLMVYNWVKDITLYQNVFADNQIIHFYR
ncbi:unnamed protein product [Soboliphyme baturini]|uniref:DNA polymerase epsilon catalytic subunit n=1 Tax=Soboliphyme baturini TaxID=241478 RepID=A0A183IF60_9BILA|nr:unnamed protein product [Soboliphyme baturini]